MWRVFQAVLISREGEVGLEYEIVLHGCPYEEVLTVECWVAWSVWKRQYATEGSEPLEVKIQLDGGGACEVAWRLKSRVWECV